MNINLTNEYDLFAFVVMYKRFGIECTIVVVPPEDAAWMDNPNAAYVIFLNGSNYVGGEGITYNPKFSGYGGFYSQVEFDKDGKFLNQGFWE